MSDEDQAVDVFDFGAARAKWAAKFDTRKASRARRERTLSDSVDRRTLRVTGRNAQFNIRCRQELKDRVLARVARTDMGVAEWFERLAEADLAQAEQQEARGT